MFRQHVLLCLRVERYLQVVGQLQLFRQHVLLRLRVEQHLQVVGQLQLRRQVLLLVRYLLLRLWVQLVARLVRLLQAPLLLLE